MKHLTIFFVAFFWACSLPVMAQILAAEEESVTQTTDSGDINGKLMLPANAASCPVALLIAGSGPTDMDGNSPIGNLNPNTLKYLAEELAQAGIASLRFDKRGIGTSASAGKDEYLLRFEDYVKDVIGWIDLLAADNRFNGIAVVGHSEGSLIGMLACQSRPKVKGYVSIAGTGRPAYEVIEEQISAQNLPEAMMKEVTDINQSLRKGEEVAGVPAYLQALFRPSVQPYLISWYRYNPQIVIMTLPMPVLILQGTTDIQVPEKDANLLKQSCPKAQLVLIEGMNHVLKACDSTDPQQQMKAYTDPSLPVDATLTSTIVEFIKQ